jgi:7-cyano-7-deazaguanine synthase
LGFDNAVRGLVGSFAIVAAHPSEPRTLRFACNYKPLFVQATQRGDLIQLTSQRQYLPVSHSLFDPEPVEIPPYSIGRVTIDGELSFETLYAPRPRAARVLALCSGGLDATVAAWKHHVDGDDVTLLHIDYGCKAARAERTAVEHLASRMRRDAVVLATDFFSGAVPSTLTDPARSVQTARDGEAAAELGQEWVPARNLVLLSLALAYAEAHDFDAVALGTKLRRISGQRAGVHQQGAIARAICAATIPSPRDFAPCGTLMKHEIVRLGYELGAPLELSWSC